jgi:hypothetical protein
MSQNVTLKNLLMKRFYFVFLAIIFFILVGFAPGKYAFAQSLGAATSGKILLQVQNRGEAWYVDPQDKKRYSLGSSTAAFKLMSSLGVGITNANLNKIQVADFNLAADGADTDNDGLSDMIEMSLGTDQNKVDTDGDSYGDKTEILNGYNPTGKGKLAIDNKFAASQKGKFLIQVQDKGEIWYVNPADGKRYFVGSASDAAKLIKKLGVGISTANLNKISVGLPASAQCDSLDCFIALAPKCQKSEGTYNISMPFPLLEQLTVKGKYHFQIDGINPNGDCAFSQEWLGGAAEISAADRQNLIASGTTVMGVKVNNITSSGIDDQINSINQSLAVKSLMTCTGSGDDLAAYLAASEQGSYGSDCTADLGASESQCTVDPDLACEMKEVQN